MALGLFVAADRVRVYVNCRPGRPPLPSTGNWPTDRRPIGSSAALGFPTAAEPVAGGSRLSFRGRSVGVGVEKCSGHHRNRTRRSKPHTRGRGTLSRHDCGLLDFHRELWYPIREREDGYSEPK